MTTAVVAALRLKSTGQTLELRQDATLVVVQLVSAADQITITRLGPNRSLLDGKELVKNTPVPLYNGASITLLESEYLITVEIPPIDASTEIKKEDEDNIPPKPAKKETVKGQNTSNVRARETRSMTSAARANPDANAQQGKDVVAALPPRPIQDEIDHGEIPKEKDSEATSDSDMEHDAQDDFDVSDESSIICSDISDIDGGQDNNKFFTIKDEHPFANKPILQLD
ncbi:hypothetical protein B0O80DRAFT_493479 [Mortierella sp. GBAus27b]|nr:hypothetical protein B0O80DRAFT_493479 [Mortierella sp. GBAus27b]